MNEGNWIERGVCLKKKTTISPPLSLERVGSLGLSPSSPLDERTTFTYVLVNATHDIFILAEGKPKGTSPAFHAKKLQITLPSEIGICFGVASFIHVGHEGMMKVLYYPS